MKALLLFCLVGLGGLGLGSKAEAQALYGLPNFQTMHPANSLQESILGSTCVSIPAGPLDLDCNPAMLANEDKHLIRTNIVGNDKIGPVNDYRLLLQDGNTVGIADKLLQQKEPLVAQASGTVWYQHDWWALSYTPFRGGFASFYRNSAYPEVTASIFQESEVAAKMGYALPDDKHIRLGLQARYVDRQFLNTDFELLQAVADPSVLSISHQKALYLEPGFNYAFDDKATNSISMMLSNVPVYQGGAVQSVKPVFDLGFTTAPEFLDGKLKTSTHFSDDPTNPDPLSMFVAGAIYDFDKVASVFLSFGKTEFGIGVNGHYESLVLGLGYKTQQIQEDQYSTVGVSTWLAEVGLVF